MNHVEHGMQKANSLVQSEKPNRDNTMRWIARVCASMPLHLLLSTSLRPILISFPAERITLRADVTR